MNRTVTLRPGARGTKRVQEEFGDQLMYVRYRYDWNGRRCIKTAEIILSDRPWNPKIQPDTPVYLKVAWSEQDIQQALREAGGVWQKEVKLWKVRFREVQRLGLEERIVK